MGNLLFCLFLNERWEGDEKRMNDRGNLGHTLSQKEKGRSSKCQRGEETIIHQMN